MHNIAGVVFIHPKNHCHKEIEMATVSLVSHSYEWPHSLGDPSVMEDYYPRLPRRKFNRFPLQLSLLRLCRQHPQTGKNLTSPAERLMVSSCWISIADYKKRAWILSKLKKINHLGPERRRSPVKAGRPPACLMSKPGSNADTVTELSSRS